MLLLLLACPVLLKESEGKKEKCAGKKTVTLEEKAREETKNVRERFKTYYYFCFLQKRKEKNSAGSVHVLSL